MFDCYSGDLPGLSLRGQPDKELAHVRMCSDLAPRSSVEKPLPSALVFQEMNNDDATKKRFEKSLLRVLAYFAIVLQILHVIGQIQI